MEILNEMKIEFLAESKNESFARSAVGAFCVELNPTLTEIEDIKTAVSEAVTNSIVHAYDGKRNKIIMEVKLEKLAVHINVIDFGVGIDNVKQALEPFYTTKPEDEGRSGMGFTVMKSFMDEVKVTSIKDEGTNVYMVKKLMQKGNVNAEPRGDN